MKRLGVVAVIAMTLTGCSSDEGPTLTDVSEAVCVSGYTEQAPSELDMYESAGADCTDGSGYVHFYPDAATADTWVVMAQEVGELPLLVGDTWTVSADLDVLEQAQKTVGGEIIQ